MAKPWENHEKTIGKTRENMAKPWEKQGHAARNDPAQFDLFSSISVCSFATLPGFCDIRILT